MKRTNNLKKTLALLLALVMSLSLCITAMAVDGTWSSVTVGGITISVSTSAEKLQITGSGTTYAISSTINNYFPQNFSMKISDPSMTVTGTDNATFEFYTDPSNPEDDGTYGLVTMGTTAATLTVKNGDTVICTISCPAPTDNGTANNNISVYAFLPAPGQFTNEGVTSGGWGDIYGANGTVKINDTNGVSLGYFGGYVVYKFATPVQNSATNPYGVDFIVYGNAFWNNSEPGCIQVSQDGTTWYDIAGSLYYNQNTIRNAHITYTNPNVTEDASIETAGSNLGSLAAITYTGSKSGTITTNPFHRHSWFPLNANYFVGRYGQLELAKVGELPFVSQTLEDGVTKTLTMDGVLLGGITATNDTASLGFGYCDVHPNNTLGGTVAYNPYQKFTSSDDYNTKTAGTSGGDPIDISWAVKNDGSPAGLNSIQYVRIYTGTAAMNGAFGEISTEVCGIAAVTAGTSTVGVTPAAIVRVDKEIVPPTNLPNSTMQGHQVVNVKANSSITIASPANYVYVNGILVTATVAQPYTVTPKAEAGETLTVQIITQTGQMNAYVLVIDFVTGTN